MNDVPPQHHRVVFMDGVVAVHGITAYEIPEAHKELYSSIATQSRHVLPSSFHGRRSGAVALQHLKLFEVYVDRVFPAAGVVLQDPSLGIALDYRGPHLVLVEYLVVDGPIARPVEAEGSFLGYR